MASRLKLNVWAPPTLTIIALLVIWQVWVTAAQVPATLLASPASIVRAIGRSWSTLWPATLITAGEGFAGFVIAAALGIPLGVLLFRCKAANAALFPLLAAAQTLPIIAIAPLFLIWFGFEPVGKVIIVAIFAIFAIVVQTIRGLDRVPHFYDDVALTCGATRTWTLWHVDLRVAAPQIFGGLRISAAYVFATAATAEYLGARRGLGIFIQAAYNSFRTPLIFAAAFMIIAMTGVLMLLVHIAEKLLIGSAQDNIDPDAEE
ncbi:ABC transporter permease [Bifidobacterium dolichotidis]|uniref:ABC transporter permease n=1 Tax=Bifidobacterium dolichotidis TaxID=2306976 RepID=UPI000F7DECFC|nr:ABC transporter permease [Bifidobacterium dolichotidis]